MRLEILSGHGGEPYYMDPNSVYGKASLRALERVFGRRPALMREGGSIPIVTTFKKVLGADSLLLALAGAGLSGTLAERELSARELLCRHEAKPGHH